MTREPEAPRLEALLAEAGWLDGLARALVRDREEARELVQDVWLAAAERAPRDVARPRAWLATVLRNALASRRRGRAPRERRERARARPGSVEGAGDVVARAEAQRGLVEHVLALDEPLRSTVLLRFFDGLSSAEIARRTGVPESTVRNRLAHAVTRLRERLERGWTDWRAGLMVLARPEGAYTIVAGGTAMGIALKVGVAAAVIAAVGWWVLGERADEPAPTRVAASPPSQVVPSTERSPAPAIGVREAVLVLDAAAAGALDEADAASEVALAPPPGALEAGVLEVVVLEDGEPCTRPGSAHVAPDWIPSLTAADAWPTETLRRSLVDGRARFERLAPGRHGIRVVLDDGVAVNGTAVVPSDRGLRREFFVGGARVEGFVYDERGDGEVNVAVKLFQVGRQETRTATDSDGAYRFDGLAPGGYGGVVEHSAERKTYFHFQISPGETRRIDVGLPQPWPRWHGVLRTPGGGEHLGGAELRLRSADGNPSLRSARIAEDGTFDVAVVPGVYAVEVARLGAHDDFVAQLGEQAVGAKDLHQDLVLPGTRLCGGVHRRNGGPLGSLTIGVRGHPDGWPKRDTTIGADGRYAIDALEPGVYLLNTHPLIVEGGVDSLRVEILPGELEVVLDVPVRIP